MYSSVFVCSKADIKQLDSGINGGANNQNQIDRPSMFYSLVVASVSDSEYKEKIAL